MTNVECQMNNGGIASLRHFILDIMFNVKINYDSITQIRVTAILPPPSCNPDMGYTLDRGGRVGVE